MPTPPDHSPTVTSPPTPADSARPAPLTTILDPADPLEAALLRSFQAIEELIDFLPMPTTMAEALRVCDEVYQTTGAIRDRLDAPPAAPPIALMPFQEQILAASRDAPILALPAARLGRSTQWGTGVLPRALRALWQMQLLRRFNDKLLLRRREEDDAPSPTSPPPSSP